MRVGSFVKRDTEEFEVEENEQVIGIKAYTGDPTSIRHGGLHNLQFKIGKLI